MSDAPSNSSAHWRFQDSLADEVAGNDFAGTITGYVDGQVGRAVTLGDNDISAGDIAAAEPGAGDFSVSLWFRLETLPGSNLFFFDKKAGQLGAGTQGWAAYINSSNNLLFSMSDGTNRVRWTYTTTVPVQAWTHYAVTWNTTTNTLTMYVNGSAVSLSSDLGDPADLGTIAGSQDLLLRGRAVVLPCYDDVRIFKRALTAGDIAALVAHTEPVAGTGGGLKYGKMGVIGKPLRGLIG